MFARVGLLAVLVVLAACGEQDASSLTEPLEPSLAAASIVRIGGHADFADGGDVNLNAITQDGDFRGQMNSPGGLRGDIVEIVPPSGTADFWCVSATVTNSTRPDHRMILYFRDIGTGIGSFDQVSFFSETGVTCVQYPTPPSGWEFIVKGDFKVQ